MMSIFYILNGQVDPNQKNGEQTEQEQYNFFPPNTHAHTHTYCLQSLYIKTTL